MKKLWLKFPLTVERDIFLAKNISDSGCDWHVDDHGFWPESFLSTASESSGIDQDGINVWIALDDMPAMYQGSIAMSAGSHKLPWRFEAYEAIGQDRKKDGGSSKKEILRRLNERRRSGTANLGACELNKTRPDLREKIEARKVVPDIKKGDAIFMTRVLFHKTIDATEEGIKFYAAQGIKELNRYSIRYTPGSAKLPNGWVAEWSAVSNPENTGRALDDIVSSGGDIWYPKVWPELDDALEEKLDLIASEKLKTAKEKVLADIVELFTPPPKEVGTEDAEQ